MNRIPLIALAFILSHLSGCGGANEKTPPVTSDGTPAATLPATLWAGTAPGEVKNISALKATAKEGDEVILRGVIGGMEKPFVDGRAMVNLIDMTVPSCADNGESCPTPWDYCCVPQEEKTKAMATIQVVDDAGRPLKVALSSDARLKPYGVIIVRGKVGPRPDANVLVVNATSLFVEGQRK